MEITDTHCHLDVSDFDLDRDEVLSRCRAQGISKIIIPAIQSKTWSNILDLCQSEKDEYKSYLFRLLFWLQRFLNIEKKKSNTCFLNFSFTAAINTIPRPTRKKPPATSLKFLAVIITYSPITANKPPIIQVSLFSSDLLRLRDFFDDIIIAV